MKRLLCIVGSMDAGGAETFLMKIYRNIDKRKFQFDFCVSKNGGCYEEEIKSLGGKVYKITPKSKNIIKNFYDIKKIVKNEKYEYVIRVSQHSLSSLELVAARLGGAKKVVFRSSNTKTGGGILNTVIHYLFRPFLNIIVTNRIAPSVESGIFMFGKKDFKIINNGLDINKYSFSENERKKYRNQFNVSDNTIVLGHVGRFNYQKNHKYLIDIFIKYHKINHNSQLWLFGKGELEDSIKKYVMDNNISKNVKFYGVRNDICYIYSAMDIYLFPSLFEGMPNTIIEAQTSGLPCLISDRITKSCKLLNTTVFIDINNNENEWLNKMKKNNIKIRKDSFKIVKNQKYDIRDVVKNFIKEVF